MDYSTRTDLRVVWLLQSRKLFARFEFWLTLVGYDLKTHSFNSRIYVLYLIIFLSVWVLAVLVLLAGFTAQILSALPFNTPFAAAVVVGGAAILAVFLIELYFASRRSPFVFSEADSQLLCLTPIDRRIVAELWFLGAWLVRGLFIWPGFVVLAYALLEVQFAGVFDFADLPPYMLAGVRMLAVAVPLHLAAMSLAWAAGAWRLQGKRDLPALRWAAPSLTAALMVGWVLADSVGNAPNQFWLQLVLFPLKAGLGAVSLPAGIALSLVWAALGLFALWSASQRMSLARAAQETRGHEVMRAATLTGAFDLADEIRQRERLGAGRSQSRLPIPMGWAALIWRNVIVGQRSLTLGKALTWVGIFGLTLGMLIAPDWGARGWFFIFWTLLAGREAVWYLARDLKHWWLMHQMPYSSDQVVAADLMIPVIGMGLAGAGALAIARMIGQPIQPILGWLLLPGVVVLGMAGAVDILQKCRSERLMAGDVPGLSFVTVVLTVLVLGVPGGTAWIAVNRWFFPLWAAIPSALLAITAAAYALYRLAGSRLRNIR